MGLLKCETAPTFMLQSESPSGSDLNALGIYLLSGLVFVLGALIEFAVVILLSRTTLPISKNVKSATMSKNIKFINTNWRNRIRPLTVVEKVTEPETADTESVNEDMGNQAEKKCILSIPKIHAIDFITFWLFLFLYLFLNCVYWNHYWR